MIDRSLTVFLITLFTVGGIVILLLTWLQPMPLSQRVASTFVGTAGFIGVLIWTLILRSKAAKQRITNVTDEIGIKNENY